MYRVGLSGRPSHPPDREGRLSTLASIEGDALACRRGGRILFRGLDFSVQAGTALALEGPNGAGKTSLLRLIAGFLAPEAGAIRLRTNDGVVEDGEERGKLAGWLGHHDAAKPQLTAGEALGFFARLYGVRADIGDALEGVGLARLADLPCQYLSAGQKKRLALARLKACARPLWLLDEPFAALDTDGKLLVRELIATHIARGGIVIAATHEPLGLECPSLALGR